MKYFLLQYYDSYLYTNSYYAIPASSETEAKAIAETEEVSYSPEDEFVGIYKEISRELFDEIKNGTSNLALPGDVGIALYLEEEG